MKKLLGLSMVILMLPAAAVHTGEGDGLPVLEAPAAISVVTL
ncbi:hypothetical protein [Phaeobacter sp. B1627]|nr:hypothetical protein [Phaeobacter sp. B1627]